jgi:uncharacterized membrane protein (DUF106 family)
MDYLMLVNMDINQEEIDYMENSCIAVCIISVILMAILVVSTQNMILLSISPNAIQSMTHYFDGLLTPGKEFVEIFIFTLLVILVSLLVSIYINIITEYVYKIDKKIAFLQKTIKEKDIHIQDLQNKLAFYKNTCE